MITACNCKQTDSEAIRIYKALQKITSDGDNAFIKATKEGKLTIRKIGKVEVKY